MEQARPRPLQESDYAFEQKEKIIEGGNEIILSLKDKNGNSLYENDIVYDGKTYNSIYIDKVRNEFTMIGSNGYVHNVQPKDLKSFERIGDFENFKHLLVCD